MTIPITSLRFTKKLPLLLLTEAKFSAKRHRKQWILFHRIVCNLTNDLKGVKI